MTIYDLGGYGTIDDLTVDGFLEQTQMRFPGRWNAPALPNGTSAKAFLAKDKMDDTQNQAIILNGKDIRLDRRRRVDFNIQNVLGVYQVNYPTELVAVYELNAGSIQGVSLRAYHHTYYDCNDDSRLNHLRKEIAKKIGKGCSLDDIGLPPNLPCYSIEAFFIVDGKEDFKANVASLTCIPHLGAHHDVMVWFNIYVFPDFQNRGIGRALETTLKKQLPGMGQKLLVLNGVKLPAARWYEKLGYGFFRTNPEQSYSGGLWYLEGHIMAQAIDPTIILRTEEGHLDWRNDKNQPRKPIQGKRLAY